MPPFAPAACLLLVALAVLRRAAARHSDRRLRARLLRAQEEWAEAMDRREARPAPARSAGRAINLSRFMRPIIVVMSPVGFSSHGAGPQFPI